MPHDLGGPLVEQQGVEEMLEREVLVTSPRRLVLSERERDLDLGADTHSLVSSLSRLDSLDFCVVFLFAATYSASVVMSSGIPFSRAASITC